VSARAPLAYDALGRAVNTVAIKGSRRQRRAWQAQQKSLKSRPARLVTRGQSR
jgi:hypothetical protein